MWPLQGSPELEGEKHKLGSNWSDRKAHLAHGRTMCRGAYEKKVTRYHWGSPGTSPRENSYLWVSKKYISAHFDDDTFIIPHFASTLTKVLVTKKKWNMMDLLSHLANKKIIPSISC